MPISGVTTNPRNNPSRLTLALAFSSQKRKSILDKGSWALVHYRITLDTPPSSGRLSQVANKTFKEDEWLS